VANTAFSLFAASVSLVITVLAAVEAVWAVSVVFGLLTVGFLLRASETRWRGR
jgi:hypothetical protein